MGQDSIYTIKLVFKLEEYYDLKISDDELMGFETPNDIAQFAGKKINKF